MLSAFMICPLRLFAKLSANFDLPDAVGPDKRIIFFNNLFYFNTKISSSIIIINYR